jgi:outer membrane protein assembly factor BamB
VPLLRTSLTLTLPVALSLALSACAERETILPGERFDVRSALDAADTGGAVREVAFRPPPEVANSDWTHKSAAPSNDTRHPALGAGTTQIWSVGIGAGNSRGHRITAQPVVAEGRIFTLDSRARVSAVSTGGALLWSADLTPARDRADDASGGGLAVADGRLFVTQGFGNLVALDAATGAVLWRQDLRAAATGAPTALAGRVYVAGRDGTGWAIDAATGRVLWTVTATPDMTGVIGGAAPAAAAEAVVFPFTSGELVTVVPETGARIWTGYLLGSRIGPAYARITDITGDPVISGGRVYAGNHSGETAAFEFGTGQAVWRADLGALAPVSVGGGSVFLVSDRNELVRLDAATGETIWATELAYFTDQRPRRRRDIVAHYGPLLAGGRLIVASDDRTVRFFDPERGNLLGTLPLSAGAAVEPVVAGGTLYVVTTNGQLAAFR